MIPNLSRHGYLTSLTVKKSNRQADPEENSEASAKALEAVPEASPEANPEANPASNLGANPRPNSKTRPGQRLHPWTAAHSYLAVMGGLIFDNTADPSQCPLPENRDSVTITGKGLLLLAELAPELIPDISVEVIRDKSKTSGLAKLIACVQATWFCLQVATRLAQRLPVTLLEMNTFAHAFCTLIIFAIWWTNRSTFLKHSLFP